ncbi:MAG: transglycosylase SLT domain-containing protein [Candidatus Hydrogenedentes bacterium]|nr:transglycosylase SLT domain-containing protein [Candidatus Hydrogenedentota bacterium]
MWITPILCTLSALTSLPASDTYLQGYEAFRAKRYDVAIRAFETAAQADPDLKPWAQVRIGMALAAQGKPGDAQAAWQRVLDGPDGPWRAMARAKRARLAADQKDDASVVAHLSGFDTIAPTPWWMDRYLWQFSESAIRQSGDASLAGYAVLRNTAETTWFIRPRLDASRVLVRSPSPLDQATALIGMLRSSAYTDIQEHLPRVPVALPDDTNQTRLVAALAGQLLDDDPANDAAALAVLRLHRDHPAARFVLAYATRMLATKRDFARAEALCNALIDLDPTSREAGETIWWLGGALERAERIPDAERVYELLPSKCSGHFRADDALFRLGELYLSHGNHEKGLGYLARLGREYPDSRFRAQAFYTCALHPAVRQDTDLKRVYLGAAADDAIGYFWAHRALARLHDLEKPDAAPPVNLRVDGVNPVLLPHDGYLEPLPPIPPMIAESAEYRRLVYFARHGMEESEWEVLRLLQGMEKIEFKEPYYRAFAEAGLAHTALQFAVHEGWGVGAGGKRSLARLRLEYPLAYWNEVKAIAAEAGLDPYLILAVAKQESTFRPNLTSSAGASGVMQLMPSTAKWMADVDPNISRDHVANLESPVNSLRLGAYYLVRMFGRSDGNLVDTLASYNGGPGNRDKWRKRFPNHDLDQFIEAIPFSETKDYVQKVLGNYAAYRSLYEPFDARDVHASSEAQTQTGGEEAG